MPTVRSTQPLLRQPRRSRAASVLRVAATLALAVVATSCASSTGTRSSQGPTTGAATIGAADASTTAASTAAASTTAASATAASTSAASAAAASTTVAPVALAGDITVFAAASLTAAFTDAGTAFTAQHPSAKVAFSFDASSALAAQIAQGAPADVFASADTTNMDKVVAGGLNRAAPTAFATNLLTIVVGPGNPKGISGLADLARTDLKVVLCAEQVPCGRYAKQALDTAKVTATPVSLEQNVKGVVTKVTAGEADAGIVYVTDAAAAGAKAASVAIPAPQNVLATYPIVTVKTSKHADVAAAFVAFLTGSDGRAILARYGFGAP